MRRLIIRLAQANLPPSEIVRQPEVGVPIGAVYKVLHTARRDGEAVPLFTPGGRGGRKNGVVEYRITVSGDGRCRGLESAAKLRSMTPTATLQRLVNIILDDKMIDAVLDDR